MTLPVLRLKDIALSSLQILLTRYSLTLHIQPIHEAIIGSYWGDDEAGIVQMNVYARLDTPIHSILHEACHTICMDSKRRKILHTDVGEGFTDEEDAVCYLQLLLAIELSEFGIERAFQDMDAWGYSFRLGSAKAWFEQDSKEAREWLLHYQLIDNNNQPTYKLRV